MSKELTKIIKSKNIIVKGARVHNLKNISVTIPHNKLIVITGVSGSGKSSLAYDTLFAEGQRRYVESLSSYARQFLGRMHKPEVDYIQGIAPAIAIEQKIISRNSRSTVGTSTEIYDYLKLLFARTGKIFSPISNQQVKRNSVADVVKYIHSFQPETQIVLLAPIIFEKDIKEQLKLLHQQGFSRIQIDGEILRIEEAIENVLCSKKQTISLVIDRINVSNDEENDSRIADSVQTAFFEGKGECIVGIITDKKLQLSTIKYFSARLELDGITFEDPSIHLFSFNNPLGACGTCEGFGSIIGIDENLIVPDKNLSIYEEAIACWKGEKMCKWKEMLIKNAYKFDFPIHRPYYQLSEKERKLLWMGNEHFNGLNEFFKYIEQESYKIQYRVMLARYRGKTVCPECNGTRLRKEAYYVKVANKTIGEIVSMQVKDVLRFFKNLLLENDLPIAKRLLVEITNRLQYLDDVGLGYLTLNRLSNTLSGGESQRINLATSLGSSLVGSMYILDEPSIGLHPRDTQRLIKILKSLRDIGNTVIVVEHDEEIIRAADEIIDLGPGAGINGGEIVFQGKIPSPILLSSESNENGDPAHLERETRSYTIDYLTGKEKIKFLRERRKWKNYIEVHGAQENNLKNLKVKFPLNVFTVVTGVSGSGKTTLVKNVLYERLKKIISLSSYTNGYIEKTITGDIHKISSVEIINQNPIGKSSRSNPITYIKAYDEIRNLFAEQPLSKMRGYKLSTFSFNVDGGRCEECEGEGEVTIEMQFMADVHLTCEACKGKRFKDEVLEIRYKGKNISEILEMTVDEAIPFFNPFPNLPVEKEKEMTSIMKRTKEWLIVSKLKLLQEVGMGYIKLGQSSSTLSGGEAQRMKLAYFLSQEKKKENFNSSLSVRKNLSGNGTFFIFNEPTIGLHFHDINKLLYALNRLVEQGHTLLVIEHNPEIIKCADWVIDLGPEGGDAGGEIVFAGTPEGLLQCDKSFTGNFLKGKL
ncbi:MAG: excinuclease ABC subunit UvrA [Bacteroidota bacterium]